MKGWTGKWFIGAAGTMILIAMCEWKSAGICTLAAKVRWYEHKSQESSTDCPTRLGKSQGWGKGASVRISGRLKMFCPYLLMLTAIHKQ